MSTSPRMKTGVSLEEFLRMPEIEEAPGLEYIDGRIEAKPMPTPDHVLISKGFVKALDRFVDDDGLGLTFFELRHTFAGRSILPDVSVILAENIVEVDGRISQETRVPPDIHVEVMSPDQSVPKIRAELLHSIAHGCKLGVLVQPEKRTIDIFRPGRPPEQLADDGEIHFAPVVPGLVISVAEVFGWTALRRRRPGAEPA